MSKLTARPGRGMTTCLCFVDDQGVETPVHEGLDGVFSMHPHHSANDEVHSLSGVVVTVERGALLVAVVQTSRCGSGEATRTEINYESIDGGRTWSVLS